MDGDVGRGSGWSLYVHVPFCLHRCSYCTFITSTAAELLPEVVAATVAEIRRFRRRPLATLYLGGGTPSLLPLPLLAEVMGSITQVFTLLPQAEVTLEANPEDVTPASLAGWWALGVRRLSIGVQSLNDQVLRLLERRHDAERARRAVALACSAGFSVSVDIMGGLPGRGPGDLQAELQELVTLGVHHLSLYLLETDKPHRLGALAQAHPEQFPNDEETARAFLEAAKLLRRAGYRHYEISNFARPGRQARHNVRTWRQQPLLAAGVAAHGQAGRVRWGNLEDHQQYVAAVFSGAAPRAWRMVLSEDEHERERVMLALRLASGAEWPLVERVAQRRPGFARRLQDFLALALARRRGDRLQLTPEGWLVSNELLQELW